MTNYEDEKSISTYSDRFSLEEDGLFGSETVIIIDSLKESIPINYDYSDNENKFKFSGVKNSKFKTLNCHTFNKYDIEKSIFTLFKGIDYFFYQNNYKYIERWFNEEVKYLEKTIKELNKHVCSLEERIITRQKNDGENLLLIMDKDNLEKIKRTLGKLTRFLKFINLEHKKTLVLKNK